MDDGYLGEIRLFAGNFAPRGWAFCDGQLISIAQHQALFSILGTFYGGDARTTFALPDLRGRAPIHAGTGPGLSTRTLGKRNGSETNTMTVKQMPSHSHSSSVGDLTGRGVISGKATATMKVHNTDGAETTPNNNFLGADNSFSGNYSASSDDSSTLNTSSIDVDTSGLGVTLSKLSGSVTIGRTGGQQPINNMQPYLTINYIICMEGMFPSRG